MSDAQLTAALAALGHRIRLDVWRRLIPHGMQGLSAGVLAMLLSVPPSSLSFHLRHMAQAGVLLQRRSSRNIIYAVNNEVTQALLDLLGASRLPAADMVLESGDVVGD